MDAVDAAGGALRDYEGDLLDDSIASVIRLLRVFLGAAVGDDEDDNPPPAPPSHHSSSRSSCGRRVRIAAAAAHAREQAGCTLWDMSADEKHASSMCFAGLVAVSREVLRDCADAKAGAAVVAEAADTAQASGQAPSPEGRVRNNEGAKPPYGSAETKPLSVTMVTAAAAAAAAEEAEAARAAENAPCAPWGGQEVERLREIACGLLANAFSHRSLRPQIARDPSLGEELLRAFHSTDDPAALTELLRLFSTATLMTVTTNVTSMVVKGNSGGGPIAAAAGAGMGATDHSDGTGAVAVSASEQAAVASETTLATAVASDAEGNNERDDVDTASSAAASSKTAATPAVGLASGLAARDTLERLAFILENSLEEKLLARACSLTYSLMYKHGDAVIRPLVEAFRLEESLASLLNSRSADLAYEKLGGTETGFDVHLRCLEVLSTSEVSSIGPSPPPAIALPREGTNPPAAAATATAGAAEAAATEVEGGCASVARGVEQQQQQRKRRKTEGEEEKEEENDKAKGIGRTTAVVESATTTKTPAISSSERRGSVIRGLVAALVPWEHSRQTQRAALLVLGNVLENALEGDSDANSAGVKDGEEANRSASESCAADLDKALAASATGEEGEWAEEEGEQEESAGIERLAKKRCEFQEAVNTLVGVGDPTAAAAADEGDGLGEELQEAAEAVRKVLETCGEKK